MLKKEIFECENAEDIRKAYGYYDEIKESVSGLYAVVESGRKKYEKIPVTEIDGSIKDLVKNIQSNKKNNVSIYTHGQFEGKLTISTWSPFYTDGEKDVEMLLYQGNPIWTALPSWTDTILQRLNENKEKEPTLESVADEKEKVTEGININDLVDSYLETAIWTEEEQLSEDHEDAWLSIDNVDKKSRKNAEKDLKKFMTLTNGMFQGSELSNTIGHDFWLTRNGHGAGFWDGDYEKGDEISKIVDKYFKSSYLYVGDDGVIYLD